MDMFWNKEEKRFGWFFIILAVYSTLALVIFDYYSLNEAIYTVDLAGVSLACWTIGVIIIWLKARKSG